MAEKQTTVIEPGKTALGIDELARYKELIYFFTWRDLKVRYKQTVLGIGWVALQPIIFVLFINFILLQRIGGRFEQEGLNPLIMVFIGFVFWQFFESSLTGTINSFVSNSNLFKKIYFPKVIPAIANIIARFIDFVIGLFLIFGLFLVLGLEINWLGFALLVPGILVMTLTAFGAGLWLGSLNVKYRDIKQVLPFFMRIMFFSSAVFFPLSVIPESARPFFYFNPAAAVIQTMREAWMAPEQIPWQWILFPVITMVLSLVIGIRSFKKREAEMVDIV